MIRRLFGRSPHVPQDKEAEPEGSALPEIERDTAAPTSSADSLPVVDQNVDQNEESSSEALGFELREPAPGELSASIMSAQDFRDLERMFSGVPIKERVIPPPKPPLLNLQAAKPAVLLGVPAAPAQPDVPKPATAAAADPVGKAEAATIASPVAETVSAKSATATEPVAARVQPKLVGLCDMVKVGESVGGWAGDKNGIESASVRVTLFVDGREVASASPDFKRDDTGFLGFRIPFPDLSLSQLLLEGRVRVEVSSATVPSLPLTFIPEVEDYARYCYKRDFGDPDKLVKIKATTVTAEHDLSFVRVPMGIMAADCSAVIGHDGFLFLAEGTNGLAGQYRASVEDPVIQQDAAGWYGLFRARHVLLEQRNIAFSQIIVPEKSTILHEFAPPELGPITARLALLEHMISLEMDAGGDAAPIYYRSLVEPLRACLAAGIAPFLRTDSHLRAAGAQFTFYQLMKHLAARMPAHADEFGAIAALCGHMTQASDTYIVKGDLGERFFGTPLYESDRRADLTDIQPLVPKAAVVNEVPEGLQNTRIIWKNPKAPCGLKVVAFANSFFERGGDTRSLSWWFKTMFSEFHFLWRAEMDIAYIDEHRPDIVICQTVERFLPQVPKS